MGQVFCLGDFNARVGESMENCIGSRVCPYSTDNGYRLQDLLQSFSLWAPSTFDNVHKGQDFTWTHPKGARARLDYILCGQDPGLYVAESYVDDHVQTSLTVRDHELVIAVVHIWQNSVTQSPHKRREYNWDLMNTPWGRERVCEIVNSIPDPPWDMDVHRHWEVLEEALHAGLEQSFPGKAKKKKIDLFAESTRALLCRRKIIKKQLDQLDEWDHATMLRLCVGAWRDGAPFSWASRTARVTDSISTMLNVFLVRGFRQVSKQLKAAIKDDKAKFIDSVVSEANCKKGVDLYHALKPLRIGGKCRRMGLPPLPGFSADGGQPLDPDQSIGLWMQHCSNMEAGVPTTTGKLLQRARKGSLDRAAMAGDVNLQMIPSLLDLEGAFRRVKKHKAGGVDDFKSDLCSIAAGPLSRKFHPLLQKVVCQVSEPIQMKGGLLIHMFKGGNSRSVEDHRGLLLSSHVGKALRRTIRQAIMPGFVAQSSDTYFSIKTGGNVSQASHALRLFISAAAQRQQSVGLVFLDIKSAYYRVVRQLLTSSTPRADTIDRLMAYFDFNGTDSMTLRQAIAERAAEDERVLSHHQELLLQELMESTWFTSSRRTELYESLAGSRPGDGLADVAFGLIFQRIMNIIMRRIKSELGIGDTDIHGIFDLVGGQTPGYEPPWLLEVIWADDLALAYRCEHAGSLEVALQRITSIVFQECSRHGLVPNLKKGKTEVLAIPKGPGCRAVRASLFNVAEPKLMVPGVPEELAEVRLVSGYKHLGTRSTLA